MRGPPASPPRRNQLRCPLFNGPGAAAARAGGCSAGVPRTLPRAAGLLPSRRRHLKLSHLRDPMFTTYESCVSTLPTIDLNAYPGANWVQQPLQSLPATHPYPWMDPCVPPSPPIPLSYPLYVPVVTPVSTPSDWLGSWKVVGHCHKCGNPIYAQPSFSHDPPITRRSCECKPCDHCNS